ncbi:hypothetical protein MES5069_510067 [Mesorhizobium escarrei]|uniref:Uncharacterized protein n=1 Tax=Mesorhizobium escarrei TaxID=666018 RepID=A0ABM9EBK9_9HYPH|nr:hypothetical protein MES5069_510067 [Mesorhizobium escarrei]
MRHHSSARTAMPAWPAALEDWVGAQLALASEISPRLDGSKEESKSSGRVHARKPGAGSNRDGRPWS